MELGLVQLRWADRSEQDVQVWVTVGTAKSSHPTTLELAPLGTPDLVDPADPTLLAAGARRANFAASSGPATREGQEWASIAVGGLNKEVEVEL
jgi:hypothetical protein